eukprot:GILK01004692.1.p1 GENE.GILK01004692.1~~GILK01004692.1.p1  ORF type:complete len:560 (+),score=70.76 GILK01004692.1:38-1681(+)
MALWRPMPALIRRCLLSSPVLCRSMRTVAPFQRLRPSVSATTVRSFFTEVETPAASSFFIRSSNFEDCESSCDVATTYTKLRAERYDDSILFEALHTMYNLSRPTSRRRSLSLKKAMEGDSEQVFHDPVLDTPEFMVMLRDIAAKKLSVRTAVAAIRTLRWLNFRDERLLFGLFQTVTPHLNELKPFDLVTMASVAVSYRYQNDEFYNIIANCFLSNAAEFRPRDVSSLLSVISKVHTATDMNLYPLLAARTLELMESMDEHDMTLIASSFADVKYVDTVLFEQLTDRILRTLSSFPDSNLLQTLEGLISAKYLSADAVARFATELRARVRSVTFWELPRMAVIASALGYKDVFFWDSIANILLTTTQRKLGFLRLSHILRSFLLVGYPDMKLYSMVAKEFRQRGFKYFTERPDAYAIGIDCIRSFVMLKKNPYQIIQRLVLYTAPHIHPDHTPLPDIELIIHALWTNISEDAVDDLRPFFQALEAYVRQHHSQFSLQTSVYLVNLFTHYNYNTDVKDIMAERALALASSSRSMENIEWVVTNMKVL